MEPCGSAIIGALIVNEGEVVRPSQLIASVRRTDAWILLGLDGLATPLLWPPPVSRARIE